MVTTGHITGGQGKLLGLLVVAPGSHLVIFLYGTLAVLVGTVQSVLFDTVGSCLARDHVAVVAEEYRKVLKRIISLFSDKLEINGALALGSDGQIRDRSVLDHKAELSVPGLTVKIPVHVLGNIIEPVFKILTLAHTLKHPVDCFLYVRFPDGVS